jgi:hypothetical protein
MDEVDEDENNVCHEADVASILVALPCLPSWSDDVAA